MATKEPHVIALDKAKIALMSRKDSAFFTSVCFSMKHKWDDTIPTACTNGKEILYSPTFFMSLTQDQRVTLLLHETFHVAYEHMGRLMKRDMSLWNQAADHVINLQLNDRKYAAIKGWLCDERFLGMGAEQVYNILEKEWKQAGSPAPGKELTDIQDLRPLPAGVDPVQHSQEIKEILVRAALRSKQEGDQPGSIPSDIEILLEKLLNPKLPWRVILQRYLQEFTKDDYSWQRFNRRFFPDWMLPSLYSPRLMNIAVAIDTSGSVSSTDFQTMVSEIAGVFKLTKPDLITLIQFDTSIKSVTKIRGLRDLKKCEFTGRGGTRVNEVIDWANKHQPQLLMFFTDGGFHAPPQQYASNKTLWLIHDNERFTSSYGKVVHYEIPRS